MKALGVDIGGTRIKAGLVARDGRILEQRSMETPIDPEEFKRVLAAMILELAPEDGRLAGVGIGCKGIINYETTRIEVLPGLLRPLEGTLLADLVPLKVPVRADNDAKVALAGELLWGAGRGRSNVVLLTLGTGVGGAVLAEGKFLRGVGGVAGHLGHYTLDPDGPVCICGNHGCLEAYFSADAIEAEAFRAVHSGCVSLLTDRFREHPERITCRDVFDAAAEGDSLACVIRDRAIRRLAAAIAGLLHIFDPEIVILGGQIVEAGAALLEPLEREVHWRTKGLLRRAVPIVVQQVEDRSGISGAAALIFAAEGGGAA
jgi:glucokinase